MSTKNDFTSDFEALVRSLEGAIAELIAQRDQIEQELLQRRDEIDHELLQLAQAITILRPRKAAKPRSKTGRPRDGHAAKTARRLLAKGPVTTAELAKAAKVTKTWASGLLARLTKQGVAKRTGRGVYESK